jgi:hypothetical protein
MIAIVNAKRSAHKYRTFDGASGVPCAAPKEARVAQT